MRYTIVIEKTPNNYSADPPDLPGCAATGATLVEVQQQIKEAIEFHEGRIARGRFTHSRTDYAM